MKHLLLWSWMLAFASYSFSASFDTITVKSTIKEVTVFLKGAQETRTAKTTLDKGVTYLKFEDISSQVDKSSIQISGKGDFTILAINHYLTNSSNTKKPVQLTTFEDSLAILLDKLDYESNLKKVYEDEREMILANKVIKDKGTTIFVEDLEDMAEFYRKRLSNILEKVILIKKNEKILNEQIKQVRNEIYQLTTEWNKPTSEIIVDVSADAKTNAVLSLSYMIYNAGWEPVYDIRAKDDKSPVELTYKANVYQNTGYDWEKVRLTLATTNPLPGGTQPTLHPWLLKFENPAALQQQPMMKSSQLRGERQVEEIVEYKMPLIDKENLIQEATTMADFTSTTESQTFTEFKIDIPYTVPTTGQRTTVEIQNNSLTAEYKYYCVPKLDKDAFLLAKVTGWDQLNLLPGQASIYFKGTFVGKSFINPNTTQDTLDISLGRDQSIVINRTKLKDFTKTQTVGNNTKETIAWEFDIRNKKNSPVVLVLEDQYPISTYKEIQVDLEEAEKASKNKDTGKLTWELQLSPSSSQKVKFVYSVKYPQDKTINNLY